MGTRAAQYETPAVLASFATDELISDAAGCFASTCGSGTFSDQKLKDEIRTISRPLARLKGVGAKKVQDDE